MYRLTLLLCLSSIFVHLLPVKSEAKGFFATGECAIVVASRKTLSKARTFILENGYSDRASVFSTKSGWLAIAIGNVPLSKSKEIISKLKSARHIPQDSYCSTGKTYTGVVNWQDGNTAQPKNQEPGAPPPSTSPELLLFGGDGHNEFLGCLNCSEYDENAICNVYAMGSEYSSKSIFNGFGDFGSEFSSSSPWNRYSSSTSVPVLVDRQGKFYGYFTINVYRHNAFDGASELALLYENANGDLTIVRNFLCAES